MKKIFLTISALAIGMVAFSQKKTDVTLEQKPVQDPKKTPVRVVSTNKQSVKKGQPASKNQATTTRKVETSPAREEKKER